MKFKREDLIRETALIQRGLNRISKSPLNMINYLVLGIGIFIIISIVHKEAGNSKGLVVLAGLTICNFVFIFLYSFVYFSRVISEEKENKTMTLLRLTPVRSTNIFYGKLLPPFINLMQMLIFQIPIVVFMVTFGGVALEQILKIYTLLILVSSCFAVIGVWVSSNNPENWLAYFNFIFMSFLIALAYGATQMVRFTPSLREFSTFVRKENPFYKCYEILSKTGVEITVPVSGCLIFILGGLTLAYRSFLKNIDFEEVTPEKKKEKKSKRKVDFSKLPIMQKEYHFGCGGKTSQILIIAMLTAVGILFYFAEKSPYSKYQTPSIITNIVIMQLSCLAIFLIYSVGNSFKKEVIEDTWDSLVLTPLTARQILNQKLMGSIKFLFPIVILIFLFYLIDFKNWARDFEYLYEKYNILGVSPFFYTAALMTFIYLQISIKRRAPLFFGISCAIIVIAGFVLEHNQNDTVLVIVICSILTIITALFYRMSIKVIEHQISPGTKK